MACFYMISWGIRQSYPSPLATLHGFRLCQWLPKGWTHGFFKGKPSLENPGFTLFCIFLGVSMDVWFKPHFSNAGFQKMLNPSESAQHRDVYGRNYEEVCRSWSIFWVFVHGSHIFSRWTAGRPWRAGFPLSPMDLFSDPVSPLWCCKAIRKNGFYHAIYHAIHAGWCPPVMWTLVNKNPII